MSVSMTPLDRGHPSSGARPGRRLAIASLLMVPALAVSYVAAYVVGVAVQGAFGLAEDELLKEAGAGGVIAGFGVMLLAVAPQIAGVVLGVKARRLGERRLGTAGVVANAAIAAYLLLVSMLTLVLG
jgi:hypothetical protein